MNFLGHSLISLEIDENTNKETLYGNFTGDFYKGLVERIELSENLKEKENGTLKTYSHKEVWGE